MPWGRAKMVDIERRGGDALEMVDRANPVPGPMTQGVSKEESTREHVVDLRDEIKKSKEELKAEDQVVTVRHATLGDYVRIFSYCKGVDWVFLVMGLLSAIGAGITMPLMNIVFGEVVTDFSNAQLPLTPEQEAANRKIVTDQTNRNTLYIVYLFLGKFFLTYVAMYSFRRVGTRLSARIRLEYLRALFSQSVAQLDSLPPGTAAATITGTANTMQIGITDKLADLTQSSALIISAYAIAFKFSWQLTLAASSSLIMVFITIGICIPPFLKVHKSYEQAQAKATSVASETVTAIRMITACGAASRMAARHKKWVDLARERGLKESIIIAGQIGPIFFIAFAAYALSFWFGIRLYQRNHVADVGEVLIVLLSVLMSVMALGGVFGPLSSATKAASAAADFFRMIDKPVASKDGWKDKYVRMDSDIRFENVTFAYPTRSHVKVLDNFSATFQKGKLTAIVGPSGSGKSTVVGLIERWYNLTNDPLEHPDPKKREKEAKKRHSKDDSSDSDRESDEQPEPIKLAGQVNIGEVDLQSVDVKFWRSHIGLVQQEPFVFNVSIYENVSYGLVGTEWEHADEQIKRKLVKDACVEAYADEYISRLPEGYDTMVGDSGMKLSGGQRQRLAIARAIVKQPTILIFDEATSSIDVRSERIVQAALDRVAKNRTTITIAHRLSTIRKADNILVMAKGRLVEEGSHDELVSIEDGVYAQLVNAQQIMMGGDAAEYDVEKNRWSTYDLNAPLKGKEDDEFVIEEAAEDAEWKNRGMFNSFGRLLVENKRHWKWLFLTISAAIGAGAAMPVCSYILASVISAFGEFAEKTDPGLTRASEKWALAFVYLAIGIGLAYAMLMYAANELSVGVSSVYRQQYFEGVIVKPIPFFDAAQNSTGSLVGRLASDPNQLQELMGTNMALMFVGIVSWIACAALALGFGWKLALVAMAAAIPVTCTAGYYRYKFELTFEKMNAAVFLESSQFAAEAFSAVRTVTSLTLEDMILSRYENLLYQHVLASERKGRWTTLVFALSHSVNLLCMALTFWYGGSLIASGEYDLKQWFIIYASIIQSFESAAQMMSFGPNMAQSTAAANRILSLRETGPKSNLPLPDIDTEGGVAIEFKDVSYHYAGRDMPVFSNLNLRIEKGQFAALVGPSGCGKSTIISLLERFYAVTSGSLTFDGKDVYGLDVAAYRRLLSLVAQEAALFQGTVRENILLGVESATNAEIEAACRSAEIWDFIMSLPQGLDTDVGSKGVAMSGGQKQRVAIARALIRNPQVLLLDEATSSLDSESERAIQGAFERAGKGRTMVVVAHRLATVQNADVIFVIGGGATGAKVLEKGNHYELLRKRGVYYQMCQSQALDR